MAQYTANIYSHIIMLIYQIYRGNVEIDDRQTFFVKITLKSRYSETVVENF